MENLTLASSRESAAALETTSSMLTRWSAKIAAQAQDATALQGTLDAGVIRGLDALVRELATAGHTVQTALLARFFDHVATAATTAFEQLCKQPTEVRAGAAAQAAATALEVATAEVLPALASTPTVDMDQLLATLSHAAGESAGRAADAEATAGATGGGGCACGGHDEEGLAELDTRVIPHAIRHATIFGALEGLAPGRGILLIANHNPLPLLAQLEQRAAGQFDVDYVEEGPETFRLSLIRR